MSYTLNQGVGDDGNESVQRGLLIGLPAIAILLSLGAIGHHRSADNPAVTPAVIPVVSSLNHSASKPAGSATGDTSSSANRSGATSDESGGSSAQSSSTSNSPIYNIPAATTTSGGSTSVIGGRGGGPTGSTSTTDQGTLPLNTTLTIPPTSVGIGDKPLVDTSGSTIKLN